MKHIRDLRKDLLTNHSVDIGHEKIHRWEKAGLFKTERSKGNHRFFNDDNYSEARNVILLIECGTPVNDFVTKNKLAISKRIAVLKKIVPELRLPKCVL